MGQDESPCLRNNYCLCTVLIANALNALKLTTQWGFWLIYNFVQLTKAGIQGNFANIGKYIFYILNAIGALFVWNDEEVRYIEGNSNKEY